MFQQKDEDIQMVPFVEMSRLRQIHAKVKIEIPATDGTENLADINAVFGYGVSKVPRRLTRDRSTEKTVVALYEVIEASKDAQIFGAFGKNLRRLSFTENQIVAFCHNYPNLLIWEDRGSFFLYESENGDSSVAEVRGGGSHALRTYVNSFGNERILATNIIVVPKL